MWLYFPGNYTVIGRMASSRYCMTNSILGSEELWTRLIQNRRLDDKCMISKRECKIQLILGNMVTGLTLEECKSEHVSLLHRIPSPDSKIGELLGTQLRREVKMSCSFLNRRLRLIVDLLLFLELRQCTILTMITITTKAHHHYPRVEVTFPLQDRKQIY